MDEAPGYAHAVAAAGLLDLSGEGFFRCEGPGAREFLQRLLANDVLKLDVGQGRRSLLLDVKGKIAADLACLRTAGAEVHLLVPEPAREATLKMLQLYGIADPLETTDATDERVLATVQGPRARAAVETLASLPPLAAELDHATLELAGIGPARVVRHDRSGLGGYDVLVPAASGEAARQALARAAASVGGGPLSKEALDVLRLEAGLARFGPDFGPETIPQEARLEEPPGVALSFDKGCFLGQEVVARLRFRGHVNKLLCGLELPASLPVGTGLWKGEKEIGRLTSVARSPRLGRWVALGYVRRELSASGTEIEARPQGASPTSVKVAALPFPTSA